METPISSSRRIIVPQAFTLAGNNNIPIRKIEESDRESMKSRAPLIDITNDSPIVGLAIGNMKTPSSTFYKKRMIVPDDELNQAVTPGSGEVLLRDQVQTLLQKVEEEAVIKLITFESRNYLNSSMCLLAPTPANTPQFSENNNNCSGSLTASPDVLEIFDFSQMFNQQEETEETLEKNVITKLLFTDFPEKSEGCDSFLDEEDNESIWSVQVNASTCEDDEEFEVDDELFDEMIKICVNGDDKYSAKYETLILQGDA